MDVPDISTDWPNEYRPTSLEDVALTEDNRTLLRDYMEREELPNLVLSGPRGVGKTTVAKIITEKLAGELFWFDASDERGINFIRDTVKELAITAPALDVFGGPRFIVLDEAGGLTPEGLHALRTPMEEYADRVVFIIITNRPDKDGFEYVRSRGDWIEMKKIPVEERTEILCGVLENEDVDYTRNAAQTVAEDYKDLRAMLREAESLVRRNDGRFPTQEVVPERVVKTVRAVAELEGEDGGPGTREVKRYLDWAESTTHSRLREARDRGYIENMAEPDASKNEWQTTQRGEELIQERVEG